MAPRVYTGLGRQKSAGMRRGMMKKIRQMAAAVMAGAMLAAAVTGCAGKQDPKEVYDAAVAKNAALESVDVDADMKIGLTMGEENMEVEVATNIKADQSDKEHLKYLTTASTTRQGQSIETTAFYTDGYYYMDAAGQKLKYPMEEMIKTIEDSVGTAEMTSDSMESIELKEDGDNRILTFTADPEKMSGYLDEVMGSLGDMGALGDVNMTIDSASGEYTINKDGYYTDMKMDMAITMEAAGSTMNMTIGMTGSYNNPGQAVEVTIPDTEGYTEIDPALMGAGQ
mgnify:FL=1